MEEESLIITKKEVSSNIEAIKIFVDCKDTQSAQRKNNFY